MATTTRSPDATAIAALADAVVDRGHELSGDEARALLDVEPGTPAEDALHAGAQRIRRRFHADLVHFCSILNTKAGNCTENCSYCAQASGIDAVDYDKHKWLEDGEIDEAAASAAENGAGALGLVAAWRGVREGSQLEMVCESIRRLSDGGRLRADVNLGILESQTCADRIAAAGAKVYGHNLETARSFFAETCTTHDFEERWRTIGYIKNAGMGLCSGGIIGMGENRDQRVEFFEQLRFVEPQMIPINFLNPVEGTGFEDRSPVDPDEGFITLSALRFFLPDRNIMVAGGKEVTFGERLDEVFKTGINAVMVGNYLTTLGTDPEFWHRQIERWGLTIACEDGCGREG